MNTSSYLVGKARVLKDKKIKRKSVFNTGEILVTNKTDPSDVPIMIRSAAIIANVGGVTCHAAVECRRMKIPCLINTGNATELIRDQEVILIQLDTEEDGVANIFRINNPSIKVTI
jgi:pyruvate,water dikinase